MDRIIDYLIKFLKGENIDIDDISEFDDDNILSILRDKKLVTEIDGEAKVAPEIYERIAQVEDRKEIIFSALKDKYNDKRAKLAREIFDYNPLAFLSKEEIREILTPEKIEELNLSSSIVENLIRATGEIEKYLNSKTLHSLRLSNYNSKAKRS